MRCWANYLLFVVVAVLGSGRMIAACGQKGPLYLPEEPAVPAPSTVPAPDPSAEAVDALGDDVPTAPAAAP